MEQGFNNNAGQDEVAEDLRRYGEHEAAAAYEARLDQDSEEDEFLVEPENWNAVQAFLFVQSQFRDGAFRYEGVEAGLRMAGIKGRKKIFPKLRLIEAGARERLSEEQAKS